MIETTRLTLRPWEARDRAPFAALNGDPVVMRHFPGTLDCAGSDALIARISARWASDGFGFAVAERRADRAFLGLVGIGRMRMPEVPRLDGAVEVGWRLARDHWGKGYATEAARAWLAYGFGTLGLDEIVAITVPANLPSQAVMRRLGMGEVPDGRFDHPLVPAGNPLRPHVLFTIEQRDWVRTAGAA